MEIILKMTSIVVMRILIEYKLLNYTRKLFLDFAISKVDLRVDYWHPLMVTHFNSQPCKMIKTQGILFPRYMIQKNFMGVNSLQIPHEFVGNCPQWIWKLNKDRRCSNFLQIDDEIISISIIFKEINSILIISFDYNLIWKIFSGQVL